VSTSRVQQLLDAFIAQDQGATPAEPAEFLDQLHGTERAELIDLIDAYLAHAPRRPVTPEQLRGTAAVPPAARDLADALQRSMFGASGEWPVLLPRLRDRARIARKALVSELAARLGVSADTERVSAYYHEMEHGLLPAEGVSDRVLDALAELLGDTAERLRTAGRAIAPMSAGGGAPAYARAVTPPGELADAVAAAAPGQMSEPRERDLVDELFTGGPSGGGGG
jgi:hypothetical protein